MTAEVITLIESDPCEGQSSRGAHQQHMQASVPRLDIGMDNGSGWRTTSCRQQWQGRGVLPPLAINSGQTPPRHLSHQ